ncbi:MAG: hypothetical protein EXR71_11900 [Myxococcales bacterium]|nr:hypothetical protein [Myxococcales bacterium]
MLWTLLLSASAAAADALPVLMENARRALVQHEDATAGGALRSAEVAAGASGMLVPPGELARMSYYAGVLAWSGGLQSQAMSSWRRLWRVSGWDPPDDGLLDDEGMLVLRALKNEGGGESARVDLSGELRGAVVLIDGSRAAEGATFVPGAHLAQVRCPDGAVTSSWLTLEGRSEVPVVCARHQLKPGATGANDAVLAEGADEDLVRASLFGAYLTDAAMRLSLLPPEAPPPRKAAVPHPPPPPAVPPPPAEPEAAPVALPEVPDALRCAGEPGWVGAPGGKDWKGELHGRDERGGVAVTEASVAWREEAPLGDLSVRLEGSGDFGLRVRSRAGAEEGVAVRLRPGRIELVLLPETVIGSRRLATSGSHVLRVDVREHRVQVRLDGVLVLGGNASGRRVGGVAVEGEPGAWVGRMAVCSG